MLQEAIMNKISKKITEKSLDVETIKNAIDSAIGDGVAVEVDMTSYIIKKLIKLFDIIKETKKDIDYLLSKINRIYTDGKYLFIELDRQNYSELVCDCLIDMLYDSIDTDKYKLKVSINLDIEDKVIFKVLIR